MVDLQVNASKKSVTVSLIDRDFDKETVSKRLADKGFEVKSIEEMKGIGG